MHALQGYGSRIILYLKEVEAKSTSPELSQLRQELKIDRILADMAPLIEGSLEGAERVSNIVQDLRRYSSGQKEEVTGFDLSSVIRKAVQWVLKASRVQVAVRYQMPEHLEIQGCMGQIHQILVNLVQNALDAMAQDREPFLQVAAERLGDFYHVRVRDQGPGIPQADLPRVFDPFFTSKPVGQGTGLGLYISYGLAHDMGGDLLAGNQPEGGAVFTLKIPSHEH
jgi:two-component system sensor histidine kinase HupT/HoxJ